MARRNKSYMNKLRHNCPTCQSSYTLLETHLTKKDLTKCPTECLKTWQAIIHKYCQEKVLGEELEQRSLSDFDKSDEENSKDHGGN
jgi:hypothetical protein